MLPSVLGSLCLLGACLACSLPFSNQKHQTSTQEAGIWVSPIICQGGLCRHWVQMPPPHYEADCSSPLPLAGLFTCCWIWVRLTRPRVVARRPPPAPPRAAAVGVCSICYATVPEVGPSVMSCDVCQSFIARKDITCCLIKCSSTLHAWLVRLTRL